MRKYALSRGLEEQPLVSLSLLLGVRNRKLVLLVVGVDNVQEDSVALRPNESAPFLATPRLAIPLPAATLCSHASKEERLTSQIAKSPFW